MYTVTPVPGSFKSRFDWSSCESEPLYIRYSVTGNKSGYTCLFSITKLQSGKYSLVDFGNSRQKDKHYSSWERAYRGMHFICRRRFAKEV